jgi:hypothetical protein
VNVRTRSSTSPTHLELTDCQGQPRGGAGGRRPVVALALIRGSGRCLSGLRCALGLRHAFGAMAGRAGRGRSALARLTAARGEARRDAVAPGATPAGIARLGPRRKPSAWERSRCACRARHRATLHAPPPAGRRSKRPHAAAGAARASRRVPTEQVSPDRRHACRRRLHVKRLPLAGCRRVRAGARAPHSLESPHPLAATTPGRSRGRRTAAACPRGHGPRAVAAPSGARAASRPRGPRPRGGAARAAGGPAAR